MLTIALTLGDPAGIGPLLIARTLREYANRARFVVYGAEPFTSDVLRGLDAEIVATGDLSNADFTPGEDQAVCGKSALDALDAAVRDAIAGRVDAIVTAPMSKRAVNLAGIPFQGHTERIAEHCGTERFAMMQSANGVMRVSFVTTHIPVNKVSDALSVRRILDVIEMTDATVREEGVHEPLIAVAALNPHAGEGGYLGDEEERLILPAIEMALKAGIRVEGPVVPDVLFIPSVLRKYDAVVSMYHDQGHIPFKMAAFDRGVNSTLGLPIIRTSPDHGTAYDLVKRGGEPDPGSFFAAVEVALKRASFRRYGA